MSLSKQREHERPFFAKACFKGTRKADPSCSAGWHVLCLQSAAPFSALIMELVPIQFPVRLYGNPTPEQGGPQEQHFSSFTHWVNRRLICGLTVRRPKRLKDALARGILYSLAAMFLLCPALAEDSRFTIYLANNTGDILEVVSATEKDGNNLELARTGPVNIGTHAHGAVAHPNLPLIYLCGADGITTLRHDRNGAYEKHDTTVTADAYLGITLDQQARFIIARRKHMLDVFPVSETDKTSPPNAAVSLGENEGISQITSSMGNSVYLSSRKASISYLQRFELDPSNGSLTDREQDQITAPIARKYGELTRHPKQPLIYASDRQEPAVFAFRANSDGSLEQLHRAVVFNPAYTTTHIGADHIIVSPDSRFLYQTLTQQGNFEWITRFRIGEDGTLKVKGHTPAPPNPNAIAFSPSGHFLLVASASPAQLTAYRYEPDGTLRKTAQLKLPQTFSPTFMVVASAAAKPVP